ncbi:MAG: hypothetical protein WC637_12315, partial [Victivallales bacterium]
RKARGKAKGDTMKVEKTLADVEALCGEECEGCCACQNEECTVRFTNFGKAVECVRKEACSPECPRMIENKDIDNARDAKGANEEELFEKAMEWYENTPEYEIIDGGKFGLRTVIKLQKALNLTYSQAANFYDRIIDENSKPAINAEKATDRNVCATELQDWQIANIAKVPGGFTVYRLDLKNKRIYSYTPGRVNTYAPVTYKTQKATLDAFNAFMRNDNSLNIDRPGEWPRKIAAKTGFTQPILFRGDYHGTPYDHKQIRFIFAGMAGFGKPRKFTNLEQYQAEMDRLRKDPNYIEA